MTIPANINNFTKPLKITGVQNSNAPSQGTGVRSTGSASFGDTLTDLLGEFSATDEVSEEDLFAVIIGKQIKDTISSSAYEDYKTALKIGLSSVEPGAVRASSESAARDAMEYLVAINSLSKDQSKTIRRFARDNAQLDDNKALYDGIGGPGDDTVAVTSFALASGITLPRSASNVTQKTTPGQVAPSGNGTGGGVSIKADSGSFADSINDLLGDFESTDEISEEDLFAVIIGKQIKDTKGSSVYEDYKTALQIGLSEIPAGKNRASSEFAAREAMKYLVAINALTKAESQEIRRFARDNAQLDDNRELWDSVSGPGDDTVAVTSFELASTITLPRRGATGSSVTQAATSSLTSSVASKISDEQFQSLFDTVPVSVQRTTAKKAASLFRVNLGL